MVDWHAAALLCRNILVSHLLPDPHVPTDVGRYVAMHAMQEDASHHEHPSSNGYTDENGQKKAPKSQMRDTIAAVGGMLIPLLTQLGHHH